MPGVQIPLPFVELVMGPLRVDGEDVIVESRAINTTPPLAGGGDLSEDRTLSITLPLDAADTHASPSADTHHVGFVGLKSGATDVPPDVDDKVTLVAGANITLTPSGSQINIAAAGGGGGGTVVNKRKASATDISNDDTLTTDADFITSIPAGKVYSFLGALTFDSNATADFKIKFTSAGGNLGIIGALSYVDLSGATLVRTLSSGTVSMTGDTDEPRSIHFCGTVRNGTGSAEDFQVQWAQNTSDGSVTSVRAGTFMRLEDIT